MEKHGIESTGVWTAQAGIPHGFVEVKASGVVAFRTDDVFGFHEVVGADLINVFPHAFSSFGRYTEGSIIPTLQDWAGTCEWV